jgi:hypothetical protein
LKGHTLSTKIEFFESTGTSSRNPRTNHDAYKQWMKHLRSVYDNYPLVWVEDMIRVPPKSRITSHLLMAHITECDDGKQYYGQCCDGKNEDPVPAVLMESEVEDSSNGDGQ